MKKIAKISVLCLLALSSLAGCNKGNTPEKPDEGDNPGNVDNKDDALKVDIDLPTVIPTLNEDSIQIHYQRKTGTYANWALWLWKMSADGSPYAFNYKDDFGIVASYALSTFGSDTISKGLGFIVKVGCSTDWSGGKDTDLDRVIDFSTLEKDKNGVYHVYVFEGDNKVYLNKDKLELDKIETCKFMYEKLKNQYNIFVYVNKNITSYKIYQDDKVIKEETFEGNSFHYYFDENYEPEISSTYSVEVVFKDSKANKTSLVNMNSLFNSTNFDDKYYYGGELGAIYSKEETTFKVWSPIAKSISLLVYKNGTPKAIDSIKGDDAIYESLEMIKGEKGVFSATIKGDLGGYYYTYKVFNKNYPYGQEIVDPYAKSVGINGVRGMIVDFSKTNPTNWDKTKVNEYDNKELAIYETHVADITSSSSWNGSDNKRYKFLGMNEEGTKLIKDKSISTGFDHIKELGVNAVQIIPFFDQANDETKEIKDSFDTEGNFSTTFNWGYNPLNYNSLEGIYSSNPYDGYSRISDFKKVVQSYTDSGINIIMDVVYNHVSGATGSNFDVLMPGYYFRYDGFGNLTNGSGCGNETASENSMMRKFIVDSTSFWAKEYKLGGFRFDLMGLHDIDTMNLVKENLNNVNPYISVYGEPWTGGTSGISTTVKPAIQSNAGLYEGYGAFNDKFRDALIKGGLSSASEKGWIDNTTSVNQNDVDALINGLEGKTKGATNDPNKSINYVTCHDNYTLKDRFEAAEIEDVELQKKMSTLANSLVFTSEATTFMLAGEEMFRSKGGDNNSYSSSYKVNELDYSKLLDSSIMSMFNNYKKLIGFKKTTSGLHLEENEIKDNMKVESLDGGSTIKYTLNSDDKEFVVLHTNGINKEHTPIDLSSYSLYLDTLGVLNSSLGVITPSAYQTIIAYK